MIAKKILLEMLAYYEKKLNEDTCTMEEMNDAIRVLEENMELYGTIGDFSKFYGKSYDAVNGVIKRRMIAKPKKNVTLYKFSIFRKLIPESWREMRS